MSIGKRFHIGIPTYNGASRVENCLYSIYKYTDMKEVTITILDDGSNEQNRQHMKQLSIQYGIPFIQHDKNYGITRSWNDLVQSARVNISILLNDDIYVVPNWLHAIVFLLDNNENIGAVSWDYWFCTYEDMLQKRQNEAYDIPSRHHTTKEVLSAQKKEDYKNTPGLVMCPAGCCFAFKRAMYDTVNGFDPNYISFYNESDFGTKLTQMKYLVFGLPWPKLYHVWGQTFNENAVALNASNSMAHDRNYYVQKWGGDFDYTNPKFMTREYLGNREMVWTTPEGSMKRLIWED